jgi:hypothetical protein
MKQTHSRPSGVAAALAGTLIGLVPAAPALAGNAARAPAEGAALVGGALPGGAVISARSVALASTSGGPTIGAPIANDGSFRATGLQAGTYRLAVTSVTVPKQTRGATFGEKVNAGLHAAGSALSQGASLLDSSLPSSRAIDPNSMPNRISMNVTVAKRTQQVMVDDTVVTVDVGADGVLAGRVAAP